MCLSTAYKNNLSDNNILIKNVASIKVEGETIILIDLMEREYKIVGTIEKIDLMDNYVIIKEKEVA